MSTIFSGDLPYRVLVTGSRDWEDETVIRRALVDHWILSSDRPFVVVHGSCPTGADAVAESWGTAMASLHRKTTVERYPARWRCDDGRYDPGAGPRRNAEMVAAGADICLAFIRNRSRGATGCARLAERAGIPTLYWKVP